MEKFEIGDKVKIVRMDIYNHLYVASMNEDLGRSGEIKSFDLMKKEANIKMEDQYSCWWVPLEWLDLVEKKKTGWNGKVVCVNIKPMIISYRRFFSVGKVYEVENGKLLDDEHNVDNPWTGVLDPIKDFNDLIERTKNYYDFIEFKGFADTGKDNHE